ncbi:MAG: hypothetical protein ACKOXB_06515 [Flavobacteriales bacterium]
MKRLKFILPGAVFAFLIGSIIFMQESCSYNELEDPEEIKKGFCDTVSTTYSGNIKNIILTECAVSGCHDQGSSYGDFTTYASLKLQIDNGNFKTKVFDLSTMPPGGFVDAHRKDTLKCWFDKGYPNN